MQEPSPPDPIVIPRPEHRLSRKNIDPDALKVLLRLHRHGYKAYLVGGGVRDLLLGRDPKDFDVSTDARPGQIRKLFNNCRIIGRRFRLAHIYFRGNKIIEVSTFRRTPFEPEEPEEENGATRRGDNTFGRPYEDAMRRDLTINGLFYDIASFSILDYVGGMEDLKSGIIRTIGSAHERFQEDPVRMLRAVRYTVRTGFRMEPETYRAALQNVYLLEDSNRFRLQDEFQKDLEGPSFGSVLQLHWEMGILSVIFPELDTYLRGQDPEPTALFRPAWVWTALSGLDASEEERDLIRERRVMSLVLPLVECRVTESYPSLTEARKDPAGLKDLVRQVETPFGFPRREQERLKTHLTGWMRLMECLEVHRLIPASLQKKAYYGKVVSWHMFHQTVAGKTEDEVRESLSHAARAGRTRKRRRPGKRRKKRMRHPRKPLDFS